MIQLGGLLVAAALLSRAGFFSDLLPGEPPTDSEPPAEAGYCPPGSKRYFNFSTDKWECRSV